MPYPCCCPLVFSDLCDLQLFECSTMSVVVVIDTGTEECGWTGTYVLSRISSDPCLFEYSGTIGSGACEGDKITVDFLNTEDDCRTRVAISASGTTIGATQYTTGDLFAGYGTGVVSGIGLTRDFLLSSCCDGSATIIFAW